MSIQPVKTAVFPVGGQGTRFLPATKVMPKEMLPVVDKPLLQYAVDEAIAAGIERLVFVTARGKGALEDYFDVARELVDSLKARARRRNSPCWRQPRSNRVAWSMCANRNRPGWAHAVWCARHVVGREAFAVLLPDELLWNPANPALKEMHDAYSVSVEISFRCWKCRMRTPTVMASSHPAPQKA